MNKGNEMIDMSREVAAVVATWWKEQLQESDERRKEIFEEATAYMVCGDLLKNSQKARLKGWYRTYHSNSSTFEEARRLANINRLAIPEGYIMWVNLTTVKVTHIPSGCEEIIYTN